MVLIYKDRDPGTCPSEGEERTFNPGWKKNNMGIEREERVYLFCDDTSSGARDGCLLARGRVRSAVNESEVLEISVVFDGVPLATSLYNRHLDSFKRSGNGDNGPFRNPILTDIAEVRRITTNSPIHQVPEDCGTWLDLYHFQD